MPFIISNVEVYASSSDVDYDGLAYNDTGITNKVTFRNVGDSVKYTITVKNTSNKNIMSIG